MDIKEYIKERTFNATMMARHLGISVTHLRCLIAKRSRASTQLAKHIESYTRGKVRSEDILTWEIKEKPSKKSEGFSKDEITENKAYL